MDQERVNYAECRVPRNWRLIREIAGVFVALVLAVVVVDQAMQPHRYTQKEADRIRPGMTANQVEALFRRPPDETGGNGSVFVMKWQSRQTSIQVVYNDGRVQRTVFGSSPPLSLWQRLRLHFGLPP